MSELQQGISQLLHFRTVEMRVEMFSISHTHNEFD